MEVYPAGLSADGMRQAHDHSSGVCVCVCVCGCVWLFLYLAYCWVLLFSFSDCMHIIMWTYRQLELLNWPVS